MKRVRRVEGRKRGQEMTENERKEAIRIIKSECYISDLLDLDRTRMVNSALDTAIEALESKDVLDMILAEIDEQYDRVHPYNISCAEGLEMALEIIDKYKASPTGEEVEE